MPRGHPAVRRLDDGGEAPFRREGAGDVGDEVREGDDRGEADREDADDAVEEALPVGKERPGRTVPVVVVAVAGVVAVIGAGVVVVRVP